MTILGRADMLPSVQPYAIALELLNTDRLQFPSEFHQTLAELERAITQALGDKTGSLSPAEKCDRLNEIYDIRPVVTFSSAWPSWHHAKEILRCRHVEGPLDQLLFMGVHQSSQQYFEGIHTMAEKNVETITPWIRGQSKGGRCLDIGAGSGAYAKSFIEAGVFDEIFCVDFPYALDHTVMSNPRIRWAAQDLRKLQLPGERFDAVWISNVLHHYNRNECRRILQNCASLLGPTGAVYIHEYVLRSGGKQSLAAAMLGLHFALTTDGGRCYSEEEILSTVSDVLGQSHVVAKCSLPISTAYRIERN